MEDDYQYVLEQDKRRFNVLKAIYRDSNGENDKATTSCYICQKTGVCGEDLLHILEYLEKQQLIKPIGTLYSIYNGGAIVRITHKGVREVEGAIKRPYEPTEHFPAHSFQEFNGPVGVAQFGNNNTANVTQNIGFSEVDDLVTKLSKLIKSSPISELNKEDAIEATNRLTELVKKEQTPGVIERVKQRLDLIDNALKPVQGIYEKAKPILFALYQLYRLHSGG